jgi:hypothetical protein
MAIGTLAAIAIGAGALGSAVIGSKASSKAAKAATNASDQSAAVQREQLAVAQNALSPYAQAGIPASQNINALLGLTPTQPTPQPATGMQGFAPTNYGFEGLDGGMGRFNQIGQPGQGQTVGAPAQNAPAGPASAQNAFQQYLGSTGYQFRLGEGQRSLNAGYAGAGTLQSGAAAKALQKYGQDYATNYFNDYLAQLGNQQGVGLSAGSALAGVGQNYANSLTQINSNKADAIGNAALSNSRNISNIFGGISSAVGYGLGR